MMKSRIPIALLAVLSWLAVTLTAAFAQTDPNLAIASAAETLNHLTSQAVPQQTIQIGTFDAATNKLTWAIPLEYLPGIPDYKRSDQGGPAQPVPRPDLNSFNVRYQLSILHRPTQPGDLQIALSLPNQQGQMVDQAATFNSSGTAAYVDFHPYSVAVEAIKINNKGTLMSPQLWPKLQPQLGAFVVPYLLLTIIYQPPGALSQACYSSTSTAGSNLSWDFATSWGLVDTQDTGKMLDTLGQITSGVGAIVSMFGGTDMVSKAGEGLSAIKKVESDTQTTTSILQTFTKSQSHGWSVSLTAQFCTGTNPGPNLYPAKGDVYVYLQNALFAYLVSNEKVLLTPIAYAAVRNETLSDMQAANVPAQVITRFQSLDAVLYPPAQGSSRSLPTILPSAVGKLGGPRLVYAADLECPGDVQRGIAISRQDVVSDGTSQARTLTTITQDTGLVASITGVGANETSVTYTSSVTHWQGSADAATFNVQCPNYPPSGIWVPTYFDTLLGTFVGYVGNPASGPPAVAGMLRDDQGHAAARRQITLTIGNKRYISVSSASGAFSFPAGAIPNDSGTLQVGARSSPLHITYRGTPLNLSLQMHGNAVEVTTAPVPPAGSTNTGSANTGSTPGANAVQNAAHANPAKACCSIASINSATGAVTAKVNATGQTSQFKVTDAALLHSLKVGQSIFADFKARQVSINGVQECCGITSPRQP